MYEEVVHNASLCKKSAVCSVAIGSKAIAKF